MQTEELTRRVNQKIDQIGNRTNLLQRGGCLKQLKEDLEKIQTEVSEFILFINNLDKEEVNRLMDTDSTKHGVN